jgi:hypothetical protein
MGFSLDVKDKHLNQLDFELPYCVSIESIVLDMHERTYQIQRNLYETYMEALSSTRQLKNSRIREPTNGSKID